jgi:hypothetical protein
MAETLTTEAPAVGGDARKTRAFSATLLGALVAPGIGTGALATGTTAGDGSNVYRPLWCAFAGTAAALNPFAANVRMGRPAVWRRGTGSAPEYGVEVPRSAEHDWYTHAIPGGYEVRSAFVRGAFALDPGFVDPDRVAFVCAPSRAWLAAQPPPPVPLDVALQVAAPWLYAPSVGRAIPYAVEAALNEARPGPSLYSADYRARGGTPWSDEHPDVVAWRERLLRAAEGRWRAHQRTLGARDVDRIRRIAPLATAYLDRRIAAPILADPVFHVRLWCRILAESRTLCSDAHHRHALEYPVGEHGGGWAALLVEDGAWEPVAPVDHQGHAGGGADARMGAGSSDATPAPLGPLAAHPGADPIGEWVEAATAADVAERADKHTGWRGGRAGVHVPALASPPQPAADWSEWTRRTRPAQAVAWSRGLGDAFAEVLAVCLDPAWVRLILAAETRAYLRGTGVERVEYTAGTRDPAKDAGADEAPAGEGGTEDGRA